MNTEETLRNGVPLAPRTEGYVFLQPPPVRIGGETEILTDSGEQVHVVLMRGTKRKRWLVPVNTLRAYVTEMNNQRLAVVFNRETT